MARSELKVSSSSDVNACQGSSAGRRGPSLLGPIVTLGGIQGSWGASVLPLDRGSVCALSRQSILESVEAPQVVTRCLCPVPLISGQSRCSFSRMELVVAVHLKGRQFSL